MIQHVNVVFEEVFFHARQLRDERPVHLRGIVVCEYVGQERRALGRNCARA